MQTSDPLRWPDLNACASPKTRSQHVRTGTLPWQMLQGNLDTGVPWRKDSGSAWSSRPLIKTKNCLFRDKNRFAPADPWRGVSVLSLAHSGGWTCECEHRGAGMCPAWRQVHFTRPASCTPARALPCSNTFTPDDLKRPARGSPLAPSCSQHSVRMK